MYGIYGIYDESTGYDTPNLLFVGWLYIGELFVD
jgi:hypothetical protein